MLFNEVVGHYRNQRQAYSNPAQWPQIDIRITEPQYGVLEVKSWYKYKGEDNPYNIIQYQWEVMDENIIYSKNRNLITGDPTCNFIWHWDGEWWSGNTDGECIQGTSRLVSKIRFKKDDYRAIYTGYDLETGAFRWGKPEEDGEFLFTRLDK